MDARQIAGVSAAVAALALVVALVVSIGFGAAPTPVAAQSAAATPLRTISVAGQGVVSGTPDMAQVQIGVVTTAKTADAALAQNSTQTKAMLDKLKALKIDARDLQTSGFSIYPTYDSSGTTITGYQVGNTVTVTIRDLATAGTLLDEVVVAGANSVGGISFGIADTSALMNDARKAAVADAQARAATLATAAGLKVGDVISISESASYSPMPVMAAADMAMGREAVPIQPGQQQITVDIQMSFVLR
jgi:uncharacterized protein YggE